MIKQTLAMAALATLLIAFPLWAGTGMHAQEGAGMVHCHDQGDPGHQNCGGHEGGGHGGGHGAGY